MLVWKTISRFQKFQILGRGGGGGWKKSVLHALCINRGVIFHPALQVLLCHKLSEDEKSDEFLRMEAECEAKSIFNNL